MVNAIIINGQFLELENVQIHDIELALLVAQKQWRSNNATVPADRVQTVLDAFTSSGGAYWQADNGFGDVRFKG